ncbi:MAG: 4-hydroxy-tetrahydrodipicolinate reductase [Pirellulales bacterium]|nr:4-hydroxy-tetrahydrodipicolinate reductase [Pirellulales bacterium]
MTIRLAIHGAAGRMGQRLIALAAVDRELELVAALDAPNHPRLNEDAGIIAGVGRLDVPLLATLDAPADAAIDFSVPDAAETILEICRQKKIPLVTATTGLSESQTAKLRAAAKEIPLLWSPNMSLAVNLTMKLAEVAARALVDKDADVEILERHHRFKEDSPSGTALKFGRIVAEVMNLTEHRHGREGRPGKRPHNEIGYHAVRVGDNPGEHTIIFALLGESIEMTVRATNRDCYALGALSAAKFLAGRPAGMYGMEDVLGF